MVEYAPFPQSGSAKKMKKKSSRKSTPKKTEFTRH